MGVSSIVVHARQDRAGVDETVVLLKEACANAIANCVVPGMVETARGSAAGAIPSHVFKHKTLIDREGHQEEVAHANAMLCHEDAALATGRTVHVSGGAYLA
jgi:NAD(P)-dependent dehydrogenase (short-subunit alcohol dehydrogenase family)